MKKMFTLALMMAMTIAARSAMPLGSSKNAMSYNVAKNEALFLSDKMAYELNLTDAQYNAVYEINLDYLMSVDRHDDVFGIWWNRRNADLRLVLATWQFDKYMTLNYFYRPISWHNGAWLLHVYDHYTRGRFYKAHPSVFVSYRGGHNRKPNHFYADRRVAKPGPAPAAAHPHHNVNHHNNTHRGNHQIAMNTHNNHRGPGRMGGRR